MGNLTKNISRKELRCNCGQCNVRIQDHEPVIQVVQDACDYFAQIHGVDKVVLNINSAARCYQYNRSDDVGSNDESQHPRCCAMDIQLFVYDTQIAPQLIYAYLCAKYPNKYGIGSYKSFTHVDTRANRARWGDL